MKVELYNDEYTGKVFEPQGIVVFPGRVGDPITPICTSAKFTFTDHDKARVEEMREWWQQLNPNMYDLVSFFFVRYKTGVSNLCQGFVSKIT